MKAAFLLFCAGVAGAAVADNCVDIPSVPYKDLISSSSSADDIARALSEQGILAIKDIPGYKEARSSALSSVSSGLLSKTSEPFGAKSEFPDGSIRRTIASETNKGTVASFLDDVLGSTEHSDAALELLSQMDAAASRLRSSVRSVMKFLCAKLDKSLGVKNAPKHTLLGDMLSGGKQLEHFHAYMPSENAPKETKLGNDGANWTLALHTDNGFLVAFSPAAYFQRSEDDEVATPTRDFVIRLRDGSTRCVNFAPDSVVIMLGEAAKMHFDRVTEGNKDHPLANMRAVPHGVKSLDASLASQDGKSLIRAWFGSMILLPNDYPIKSLASESAKRTYGSFRSKAVAAFANKQDIKMPIGCVSHQHDLGATRILEDAPNACAEGELYCWLTCADASHLSCTGAEVPTCVNKNTGAHWTKADGHCHSCEPQCAAPTSTQAPTHSSDDSSPAFCNGIPSSMHMDGFTLDGTSTAPCTVLFFRSWAMNDRTKLALGAIGTFLLGVGTEWLVYTRRQYSKSNSNSKKIIKTLLYGLNVFAGYMLMLAAMTYSVAIFIMVIGGLTIGHGIFNWNAEVGETTDPCCSGQNESRAKSTDSSRSLHSVLDASAGEHNVVLHIKGMTCMTGCGSTVQEALRAVPGVEGALVDMKSNTATVWGESKLDAATLIECVNDVGFEASEHNGGGVVINP